MHWQWLVGPSAAFLGAAATMAGLGQAGNVADELSRVVGLVVPLVGALLAPLVAAIIFLFKALVVEMRANRAQTERLVGVVADNSSAFRELSERIESLEHRVDADHEHHERRAHP